MSDAMPPSAADPARDAPAAEPPVRRSSRSRWLAIATLVVGVGVALWLRSRGGFELDPSALREWIAAQGWRAPLVYILACTFRIFLVLPSWVVMSAGGLLFGVPGGTVFSAVGFTLGALLAFGLARELGRDVVERRLSGGMARMDAYLMRRGTRWLAVYTALPVTPLTPAHGGAGLSGMSLRGFAVGAAVGMVPRAFLFSYFGDRLATGDARQIALALAVVLLVAVVGVAAARRMTGRAATRSGDGSAPSSAGGADAPSPHSDRE